MNVNYEINFYKEEKIVSFFDDCGTMTIFELIEVAKKEFPQIPMNQLEISAGDECIALEKRR